MEYDFRSSVSLKSVSSEEHEYSSSETMREL